MLKHEMPKRPQELVFSFLAWGGDHLEVKFNTFLWSAPSCAKCQTYARKPLRLHIMIKMIEMKVAYCLSDLSRTLPSFWEVTQFSIELHPFSAKLQTTWLTCCAAAMNRTKSIPLFAMVLYSPRKLLSTLPPTCQTCQTCSNQLHN